MRVIQVIGAQAFPLTITIIRYRRKKVLIDIPLDYWQTTDTAEKRIIGKWGRLRSNRLLVEIKSVLHLGEFTTAVKQAL